MNLNLSIIHVLYYKIHLRKSIKEDFKFSLDSPILDKGLSNM